jgi:hypothetical protein
VLSIRRAAKRCQIAEFPCRASPSALAGGAVLLAACSDTTPLWGPDSPRNGAQQPVDPVYGTPIPGDPLINGGRD